MGWQYTPPVEDVLFYLEQCTDLIGEEATNQITHDLARAILTEAGRFAADVLVPINGELDRIGARQENGRVITSPAHKAAFDAFVKDGWVGLNLSPEWGGQGLPSAIYAAALEFWHTGSLAFAMGNFLTVAAVETIAKHGSKEIKETYLRRLISGEFSATMALTEPSAGSDLNTIKVKAMPLNDGSYAVSGSKIFISYGDHDLTENIIHLVLARLSGAADGSKGLSLFLVPKKILTDEGLTANHVTCVGIEEKLGLHGSPTCTLQFSDGGVSRGWLIGASDRGLRTMFTMMNTARMAVATQGVAASEWAYQQSLEFASERKQRRGESPVAATESGIVGHPDVQNMLLSMRALASAGRCIILELAAAIDRTHSTDCDIAPAQAKVDLLTPVAKAFCTDSGIQSGSLGIQVHGGMGVIEHTGISQVWRDARVSTIYEGTNGIQAIDFVCRKLTILSAESVNRTVGEFADISHQLTGSPNALMADAGRLLSDAVSALTRSLTVVADYRVSRRKLASLSIATSALRQFALVAGCAYLGKAALATKSGLAPHHRRYRTDLCFFAHAFLSEVTALERVIAQGEGILGQLKGDLKLA